MVRSRSLPAWWLIAVGAFGGCRVGYDEVFVDGNAAGDGGSSASGGAAGSTGGSSGGSGGTESGAGEAGTDARGGMSVTGGSAGSAASGGSSTTGGEGGAPAFAGTSAGGASAGSGTGGSSGGEAGASGGTPSGASGETGEGGANDGGISGVSNGNGSGTGGGLGSGGFAGASSLGDCQTATFGGHDYVFCNVNLAWTAARDNCASIGMSLVRVDDTAESQWVYDNVYDAPPRQGVWLGASDLAAEGEWRWPDGTLFWLGDSSGSAQNGLYSAWYASQPSGQEPRDCAALDGTTLGWYDLDCAIPQPYACEGIP